MNLTLIEREEELFRIWQSLPAPGCAFRSLREERIVLIAHGRLNDGPGPDFLNAVLLIDGSLRVGHVEMHLRESDWFAHGHMHDPAYDAVLLHVLAEEPTPERLRLSIPTLSARSLLAAVTPAEEVGRMEESYREEERRENEHESVRAPFETIADGLSLNLLAELAWGRLLRRVTEIVRDEPPGGDGRDKASGDEEEERVRRAFLIRLFDSLGYSRNRRPMKEVAEGMAAKILAPHFRFVDVGFDAVAAMLFAVAGIPAERLEKVGRGWMSDERLRAILPVTALQGDLPCWDYRGRPANAPELRLWGGAKLLFDFLRRSLLEEGLEGMRRNVPFNALARPFQVRLGSRTILGRSRAAEIVLNVLCPVGLAAGILRQDNRLIEGACLTYRNAPSLASNRLVREVERRFAHEKLEGAFLQQGAIEYYQRVLSPDRSGYSMIAEPRDA